MPTQETLRQVEWVRNKRLTDPAWAERRRAYYRKRRKENGDYERARERAWGAKNKDRVAVKNRKWLENHPREAELRARVRGQKYVLTGVPGLKNDIPRTVWDAWMLEIKHSCECCGGQNGTQRLYLDHDYDTNLPRGALCNGCNSTIAKDGEPLRRNRDPVRRRQAAAYLRRTSARAHQEQLYARLRGKS